MSLTIKLNRFATPAAIVLLLGITLTGQDRSLPEVAKEKSGKAATRIFTEEDLEPGSAAEASAASVAAESETKQKDSSETRVTVAGLLEQATLPQARAILQSLKRDEQVLLRRYAQIQQKLTRETDQHLRQLYSNSLARRDETLARKRAQIQKVQKAITAVESDRTASPGSKNEGNKPEK